MSSNASDYQNLVGKTLVEAGKESEFSKSDSLVFESDLPKNRRIKKPGFGYTCDFDEDRLEVKIDEHGTIKSIRNG